MYKLSDIVYNSPPFNRVCACNIKRFRLVTECKIHHGMSDLSENYFDSEKQVKSLRTPPHSIEAEQSVLGGLMLSPRAWDAVADRVSEEDFYRQDHKLIFRSLKGLSSQDKPRDVVTCAEWLENNGKLDDIGGMPYLALLAEETPSAANIQAYADIVRERSVLRQLIEVGNNIAGSAYQPEGRDTKALLDQAETQVFAIAEQNSRSQAGFSSIKDILVETVDRIDQLYASDDAITGVSTGFTDFDGMTSGLQRSDLIIVAGRPSMGKTTFSLNIAESVALTSDDPVAVFSMEMPGEQLAMRMISSLGRVELQKIRTGNLGDADWPRVTSAISLINQKNNLYIDDTPGLTPNELRARARRLKREHGLSLVVVDYLQLMQVGGGENRTAEISEISRNLKAMAKELDIPVIALSQLNRSLEQRPDKRPVMSDLRESGAIEQDADVIVFIYRDEVYNPESPDKGTAEILIRKQRNGPTGSCRLAFLGQYTRFEDFTPDVYQGDSY